MPEIITAAGKGAELTPTQADSLFYREVNPQSGNYTVDTGDNLATVEYTGSGGHTITLPDASTLLAAEDTGAFMVRIKHGGTGTLTVARDTGDTVDGGAANITLIENGCVTLKCGSVADDWMVLDNYYDFGTHQSAGASGYQKLPGGLILQWGTISTGSIDAATAYNSWGIVTDTLTYPVAFGTACYSITFNSAGSSAGYIVAGSYGAPGTTTCAWFAQNATSTIQAATLYWMAIGK